MYRFYLYENSDFFNEDDDKAYYMRCLFVERDGKIRFGTEFIEHGMGQTGTWVWTEDFNGKFTPLPKARELRSIREAETKEEVAALQAYHEAERCPMDSYFQRAKEFSGKDLEKMGIVFNEKEFNLE